MNVICARSLLLLSMFFAASTIQADTNAVATISVRGEAVKEVPADQVSFSISVETAAKSAEKALEENSEKMAKVRERLLKVGLKESEFNTVQFSVMPQWQPRPRQASSSWKPKITGYLVRNQLRIKTSQLTKIGEWMQAATESGANQIGQLHFGLQDADQYRADVISEAVSKARIYADAAAKAAGVNIRALASIQVDGASVRPMMPVHRERVAMAMADSSAKAMPQITPGKIEVRSNVSVTYQVTNS